MIEIHAAVVKKNARELNISRKQMQHILKNELGLKPLKFQNVQELIDGQKQVGLERAKELLRLHESGQLPNYLPKGSAEYLKLQLATRNPASPMVMVRAAVTADSRSPLVFIDRGVKINAGNKYKYRENVLKTVLKSWTTNISPAHHAHSNRTQHSPSFSTIEYLGDIIEMNFA